MKNLIETLKLVIARKVTMKDLLDIQSQIDDIVSACSGVSTVAESVVNNESN